MIPLRRGLLELWGMLVIALAAGFAGPFGTYRNDPFLDRVAVWSALLMGAYVLVRPLLPLLGKLAAHTLLPARSIRFWGAVVASAPLALFWGAFGRDTIRTPDGPVLLASFALLGGLAVFGVAEWSRWADRRIGARRDGARPDPDSAAEQPPRPPAQEGVPDSVSGERSPPLLARLSASFSYPVIALQSEDHYVRVHGNAGSELLLMRLRDAIAEMGDVQGERVHRSWWVALAGVVGLERSGRTYVLPLANGVRAPVARDSVARLQRAGLLPHAKGSRRVNEADEYPPAVACHDTR